MAASHTAKVSICSNCLGGKWSCVSISLISRDIRWHHRIFHSRECGAGPEFVPAVISSGQSCSHKYHSFGSYSPDWSAIGTEAGLGWAELGWAGLGWDVEIIEEFLLRNPGAGCPWWWVYNSVLTPRVLMYSHKKPQRRGPQYNLSINHRDTAARRPDGLHRTHHHQPTHIMSTHTHTSTHYLHTSTHYLSTSTHHCQCHTTQHRSWQGSLILHILQANASQPSHSLSYHWSFIYW